MRSKLAVVSFLISIIIFIIILLIFISIQYYSPSNPNKFLTILLYPVFLVENILAFSGLSWVFLFIFLILINFIFGIVLPLMALHYIKNGELNGKGLAITALIISIINITFIIMEVGAIIHNAF